MEGRRGKGIGLTWINLAAKEPTGEVRARRRTGTAQGSGACVRAFVLACVLERHSIKWIYRRSMVACSVRNLPCLPPEKERGPRASAASGALLPLPVKDLLAKLNICAIGGAATEEGKAYLIEFPSLFERHSDFRDSDVTPT